jgi:peptide chain release factor
MLCWLQITSGRGPDECAWVVSRVVEVMVKEASANGCHMQTLETVPGSKPDLFKSALISIEGEDISTFLSQWAGTIQWIGKSQFRPRHKRKNWFVGVAPYPAPEEIESNHHEFRFETMRSSGPGGQHVNKTASAVRVVHVPTGIHAIAQEERSQHRNRKLALSRLLEKLRHQNQAAQSKLRQSIWDGHNELERGNPVRIYEGTDFRLKRIAQQGASNPKPKGH